MCKKVVGDSRHKTGVCILYVGLALLIESSLVSIVDMTVAKHLVSFSSMPTCNRSDKSCDPK